MDLTLWVNNCTSIGVVLSCWWLAHQYSTLKPPGRAIAGAFAFLGFATLFTMFARNFDAPIVWSIIVQKSILTAGLLLIIVRRTRKERER